MKDNHVPRKIRLQHRIGNLECKLPGTKKIGGGNPYYQCCDCGRSEPDISNNGHYPGCSYPGILKEIAHYKKLLAEENLKTEAP